MRLTDLIETFKGHDKVIFKLTGIGGMEYNTVEFKDAIDTIESLQQENEQLKADCDRMLGEVQELTMEYNHFKERLQNEQLKQENKQFRAQAVRMWEALRKAKEVLYNLRMDDYPGFSAICEALTAIDKVIGGKEDE